jgi:hypothetical protein
MDLSSARIAAFCFTILFILGILICAFFISRRRGTFHVVMAVILTAWSYVAAQLFLEYVKKIVEEDPNRGWIFWLVEILPSYAAALLVLMGVVVFMVMLADIQSFLFTHITPASIREGIDALPDGMLFSYDDGSIQLINPAMNSVAEKICGKTLTDGNDLISRLSEGSSASSDCTYVRSGDTAIVKLPDGAVYSFEKREKSFSGSPINEVLCFDVTRENELAEDLDKKNKELEEQNERLRVLNESITDMTIEDEILKTRIKIHDELGNCIATARHYLAGEGGDRSDVLVKFRNNVSLLDGNNKGVRPSDLETVLRAAKDVGVAVNIEGEIPQGYKTRKIIAAAIRECIANTFKHAKGDAIFVRCVNDGGLLKLSINNNGNPPEKEIVESGGLLNLRKLVERSGGSMKIESKPGFLLTITLDDRLMDILPEVYTI